METTQQVEKIQAIPSIKRSFSCYRPMAALGKEIKRIVLHDGEKVLYTRQSGWLEHTESDGSDGPYCYSRDVVGIYTAQIRNARKVDLSKRDNFIVPFSDKDKGFFESGHALYLYVSDYTLEKHCERLQEDGLQVQHFDIYSFSLDCNILMPFLKDDAPEGSRLGYKDERVSKIRITTNVSYVTTSEGTRIDDLCTKLNEVIGCKDRPLSNHTVQKLLKHFMITPLV